MLNFKNILYPIDLDSKNISSVVKALEFAQMLNCPIHILYVNDMQAGYRHPTDHEDAVALRVKKLSLLNYWKIKKSYMLFPKALWTKK